MLQLCRDLHLAQEPFGSKRRGQIGLQDLDSHLPVVTEVPRQEDRRHPAGAGFAHDLVPAREGPIQVSGEVFRRIHNY